MGTTDHYGLKRMGAGESFADNGYQYTDADRQLIDRLLYLGAEGHHHVGAVADPPTLGTLTLTVDDASGSIPAGTRVYYKFTLVDVDGFESAPSDEEYVDTTAAVAEPAAVALTVTTTGGTLLPGQYYYVVTAYTSINTNETKALYPAFVTAPVGTSTNRITLTLPTLPSGATGFNIYRKGPGEPRYFYLASTTSTTTYIDTGAVEEDCNRTVPVRNSTNSTNNVTASIPTLDPGYTWKLYRTYVAGFYNNSLVHHVVEETTEGSGIITPEYIDMGLATLTGTPPVASQTVGGPDQIDLSDMSEVQGTLPMSGVSAFPFEMEFHVSGTVAAVGGSHVWVCEFPRASIRGVRAALGQGYRPASQSVIVDVNVGQGATPWPTSIFSVQADQPRVIVGEQIGDRVAPTARTELVEGDVLTVDVDQAGGGATPTDADLSVFVYMWVYGFESTTSFTYPTSTFTPLQVPGLVAWFKGDGITGLADAAPVTTWIDSSGQGHDVTQATSGNRPTYRVNAVNSKPVVRFDGTNDYLKSSAFTLNRPTTVIVVAKSAVTTGTHTYVDGNSGADLYIYKNSTPSYVMDLSILSTATVDTGFHIMAATFDGTNSKWRVNGGAGVTGSASTSGAGAITLGAFGSGATNFLNGDIAEVIVYSTVLSLTDLNAVGTYLNSKYGTTWTTAT
jgi:hypothetical protein